MTHRSEDSSPLAIKYIEIQNYTYISQSLVDFNDVLILILPPHSEEADYANYLDNIGANISSMTKSLGNNATILFFGDPIDLVHVHQSISDARFQLWISIKRQHPKFNPQNTSLPEYHWGASVYTKYEKSLQHTDTRVAYSYCPACDKTTKDYGGKKHTYDSYGTLLSDVWRDISCDLDGDLTEVLQRFADLFGIDCYRELHVLDYREHWQRTKARKIAEVAKPQYVVKPLSDELVNVAGQSEGKLMLGDCLENLRQLPDNSVDFAFIDPPYNLGKSYNGYADDRSIQEYFSWCDEWIKEVSRVLRPGRTIAILNIPLWAIRHFMYMETILRFQNWIAWDALSFPVRKIMPANYAIICFSKGEARPLPGLIDKTRKFTVPGAPNYFLPLQPMEEGYCLRSNCISKRNAVKMTDRGLLTDMWWDIHRVKHNSRRVDHPCQLPPHLMYRLISIFTEPNELVLDCFDGAGTTSLTAHQMSRQYIGIELSEKYHQIATNRHQEIVQGIDPFRKVERELTEKNSRVARMPKLTYVVPKKTLQLEVRRIANELNRLPTRDDISLYSQYSIQYYDEYFSSWGEVCAAARHNGMTETKQAVDEIRESNNSGSQLNLFSDNGINSTTLTEHLT